MTLNLLNEFLLPHFYGALGAIRLALPILLIFLTLELFQPGMRLNWRSTFFNIWYTPVFLTVSSISMSFMWPLIPDPWLHGLISFNNKHPIVQFIYFALYLLMFDFSYYWLHRAQHQIHWLWKYHATHHADPNISALSTSRHHWLEEVFRFIPVLLPLSIVFGRLDQLPLWALVFPGLYGIFIHWNTPLRMQFISKWIVTPCFHRIHHSIIPEHRNKNFAVFFPFWDIVFGTAYFSQTQEFPKTGIDTKLSANSLRRLLPLPQQ